MGRMNIGPGRLWSDATQDAIDEILETKYKVTGKFLDKVDAGDPKAVAKAREIYAMAKKDGEAWEEFCEVACNRYEDYRPKRGDFFYALQTGLLIVDIGPLSLALSTEKKRKKVWPTHSVAKKAKKTGGKK